MQHLGGAYSRNLQVLFRRGRDSTKCQIEAGLAGAGGVTQDGLGTYSHLMDVLGRTVGDVPGHDWVCGGAARGRDEGLWEEAVGAWQLPRNVRGFKTTGPRSWAGHSSAMKGILHCRQCHFPRQSAHARCGCTERTL